MLYYLQIIKEQDLNTFQKYHTMLYTPKDRHSPSCCFQTTAAGNLCALGVVLQTSCDSCSSRKTAACCHGLTWDLKGKSFLLVDTIIPLDIHSLFLTQLSKKHTVFINTEGRKSASVFKRLTEQKWLEVKF